MLRLPETMNAWGTDGFEKVAKAEIQSVPADLLQLQSSLCYSNYLEEKPFHASILSVTETVETVEIKTGIFFTGIIASCPCSGDDPDQNTQNEYCEILFTINKNDAVTCFTKIE